MPKRIALQHTIEPLEDKVQRTHVTCKIKPAKVVGEAEPSYGLNC